MPTEIDFERLRDLAQRNSELQVAIEQQKAQAEALRSPKLGLRNTGEFVAASTPLELIGALVREGTSAGLRGQASAGQQEQVKNTGEQNQSAMQRILQVLGGAGGVAPQVSGGGGFTPPFNPNAQSPNTGIGGQGLLPPGALARSPFAL